MTPKQPTSSTTSPVATPSKTGDDVQLQYPQNSVQHVITLEHGVDCRSRHTIHAKVLCGHSPYMQQISAKAELLREKYDSCNDLLERIEAIGMADLTPEQYEEKKLGPKLLRLILLLQDKYPLQEYQKSLTKAIGGVIERQFVNKNVVQSDKLPKNLKVFRDLALKMRFLLLNAEGALEVAEELCAHLQTLKAKENQKAKNNPLKAWAQGRLLLRGVSEKSVLSLVEWAYESVLRYDDTEHLYDIWGLATRLRVEVLAETCLDRLYEAASSSIHNALSNRVPLRQLLGLCEERDALHSRPLSDGVVKTVFQHVFKDEHPPPKLTQLVVHAMARGMDLELWTELQDTVNQAIVRQLVSAMVAYRDIKIEQGSDASDPIKLEALHGRNDNLPDVAEAQQGVSLAG